MKYKLTNKELTVMQILWAAKTDLSITDFIQWDPTLSTSTVQAALRSLLKKSYIEVANILQHNKVFARTYLPRFTETDYMTEAFRKSSLNIETFFSALVESEESLDTLSELEKIIENQRKKLLEKDV